jgi:hypothetical protein
LPKRDKPGKKVGPTGLETGASKAGYNHEPMIRLSVQDGSIFQTVTVEGDKVSLGRTKANTIRLKHASVSRKHCMIRHTEAGTLEVFDLNSRNGTRRNGESIDRSHLAEGDELLVGDVVVRVEALAGAPVPATTSGDGTGGGLTPFGWKSKVDEESQIPAREKKALISEAHQTSFSEELFSQTRRMPWWAGSIFVHSVLIYLMFLIPFKQPPVPSPVGRVNGELWEDLGSALEDLSTEDLDDLAAQEPDLPDEPVLEEEAPTQTDEPQVPEDQPAMPPVGAAWSDLTMPSSGLTSRISIPDSEFGKEGAADANKRATALLRRSMRGGAGIKSALRSLERSEVLAVEGSYDHVESVLDLIGLRHERVSVKRLTRTKLDERKVLLVNCSSEAPSEGSLERIRRFVKNGGYLLTTDWAIENVVRRAFPGYLEPVKKGGRNVITPDEVVLISAVLKMKRHFLLAGTAFSGGAKWWLEESSYPFKVLKPDEVEVLIESDDLERRYGARAVAATFRYGKGRVFHMLGHFYQKEGNLKGTFSTQRLIANFIIAAIRKN